MELKLFVHQEACCIWNYYAYESMREFENAITDELNKTEEFEEKKSKEEILNMIYEDLYEDIFECDTKCKDTIPIYSEEKQDFIELTVKEILERANNKKGYIGYSD